MEAGFGKEYEFGRNQPCPCWSGKKYKRCCLADVDRLYGHWRSWDGGWLPPDFARTLAACGGLRPAEGEVLPDRADLEEALLRCAAAAQSFVDGSPDELATMAAVFGEIIREDDFFREVRLSDQETKDLLNQVAESAPADAGEEREMLLQNPEAADRAPEWIDEAVRDWLDENIGRDDRLSLIDLLWQGLRQRRYEPRELTALLLALWYELGNLAAGINPFWYVLARVSVAETLEMLKELERMAETAERGEGLEGDEVRRLLERNPALKERVSREVWTMAEPVLGRLMRQEISLAVPPYAVICGLLRVLSIAGGEGADAADRDLGGVLARLSPGQTFPVEDKDLWLQLAECAWGEDYELFTDAARAVLAEWLDGPGGRECAPDERRRIGHFIEILGDLSTDDTGMIHLLLYIYALQETARRGAAALPVAGEPEVPGLAFRDCFTSEGLTRYAAYLERHGLADPAAHVLRARDR